MLKFQTVAEILTVKSWLIAFRFFLPALRYASAVLAIAMCPSVCPSQAGIVSKRLNGSRSFWRRGYPRLILHCDVNEFGLIKAFPCGTFPKLWT